MKKRNVGVLLLAVLLVMGTSGTAALADTDLWDGDDVLDEDDATTDVTDAQQEASVTLEGPDDLEVDELGSYDVTVSNDSGERALDEWALGLSVDNIASVDDLTITEEDGESDITDGDSGFEVELDGDNDIIYLRDDDTMEVEPGATEVLEFEVAFQTDGEFTGTAYVIEDEAPTGAITGEVFDLRTDEAIEGASVEVTSGPTEASTDTDEDGNFELGGLEDGDYALSIDADGYSRTATGGTVEDGVGFTISVGLDTEV